MSRSCFVSMYQNGMFFVFVVARTASSDAPSMTEVAFEVLVGEEMGRDFDVNECEEFVDQCTAFAIQLADEQKRCARWQQLHA